MKNELLDGLDAIFIENGKMAKYAEENILLLQKDLAKNTVSTKYGIASMYGGYFCPSLVMEKTTGGFRKGRLSNSAPKNRNAYSVYEIGRDNELPRLQSIENSELSFEHYVIRTGNTAYCVGMSNGKACSYAANTRAMYLEGRIKQFDIINPGSLWSEQYEYARDKITCRQYYYVPELEGSKKSIPIGEKGCPAALYIINFRMNERNGIDWLEHGQYLNGKLEVDHEYGQ